jgi:hypothetical protein
MIPLHGVEIAIRKRPSKIHSRQKTNTGQTRIESLWISKYSLGAHEKYIQE